MAGTVQNEDGTSKLWLSPHAAFTTSLPSRYGVRSQIQWTCAPRSVSSQAIRKRCRTGQSNIAPSVMSASAPKSSDSTRSQPLGDSPSFASWQEELRMLLDPSLSLSAKSVLVQDMAKRAPEVGREVLNDACAAIGIDGIPAVVQQVTEDIIPNLIENSPRYISEISRAAPLFANEVLDAVRRDGIRAPMPSSLDLSELLPAAMQEFRNVFNNIPEGLETPSYEVLTTTTEYELRRYPESMVAMADMGTNMDSSVTEVEVASAMQASFRALATYIFGRNSTNAPIEMTTPVIFDQNANNSASLSFLVPSKYASDPSTVPLPTAPVESIVMIEKRAGTLYAVAKFAGYATTGEIHRQLRRLLNALSSDGISVADPSGANFSVFIYNGPSTLPFKRRNEICMRIACSKSDMEMGSCSEQDDN